MTAIRSELCSYDMATGEITVILQSPLHIEAPNWTPDGKALIVNGGGLLYRVALDRPRLDLIDTGFAAAMNNDHGISPDGKTLVISNHTVKGFSCIYTLPVEGGTPVQITEHTPSWWHGWSPDGKVLAYTARRDAVFDIYTIPVGGGEETRVTQGGGHHDGPDYTPDGEWIWFNSDVSGSSELWRIRPNGSDRQQMTNDERVNWFPHPSPDGKHVMYLAYPEGTLQHPGDLDVELRLMSSAGGKARVLVKLFGGQGSINVPCWRADSGTFAFIRYFPA